MTDVCNFQYGYAFDSRKFSNEGKVPLVRIRDVVRGYSETYTDEDFDDNYLVHDGDMLIGMDGEFNIAYWHGGDAALNQRVCKLVPSDKVDSAYIFYRMVSVLKQIESKTPFVTVKHLSAKELNAVYIDLPNISEQEMQGKKLRYIDGLIAKNDSKLKIMDILVKSRFIEMFGNLSKGSDSENSITLQEMLDRKWITYHLDGNHGGDYPRSHEFIDDGVPYISANCIVNGKIDFSRGKYVSEERANRFRKGIACNKDVLFAHNATVGPVVVLETQYPKVILGTSLTAYRCDCEHIIPEYLKAYMEHPIFTQQYEADMQQTTRNQVPITKQRNYRFIIPKMSYQKEFAAFVELTDKSKLAVQQSIETLQTLKEKLMQDYFG